MRVNFGDRPFAYGEGHAHRNAADIQKGDSAEELAALFEVLPFALGMSDSEEEEVVSEGGEEREKGGNGIVVELSHTGPPAKKMKTPIATVGKSHLALLERCLLLLTLSPSLPLSSPSPSPSLSLSLPPSLSPSLPASSPSPSLSLPPSLPPFLSRV